MRNQWEKGAGEDLDAPVTITGRELRSLRRRAGFGVFATLLGAVAVSGVGWTLYAGTAGLEQVQGMKERVLAQVPAGSESPEQESTGPPGPPAPIPSRAADSTTVPVAEVDSLGAKVP